MKLNLQFKKSETYLSVLSFAIAILLLLSSCISPEAPADPTTDNAIVTITATTPTAATPVRTPADTPYVTDIAKTDATLQVHYIDVGQGHCVLIEIDNKFMLIDAGTGESTKDVVAYLNSQNVKTLYYVIATHPHEDHIGGMTAVLSAFKVEKIIMPNKSTTTKIFENFIDKIIELDIPVDEPLPGKTYSLGDATFNILAPNSKDYKDLNDYSVTAKLIYKEVSFLFTGDATSVSESEMVAKNYDLKSTVLMVGHHGSSSSTSDKFLAKVAPEYTVISCGKGNSYGHPTDKILNKLTTAKIAFFRTDEMGSIVASTDGKDVQFSNKTTPITPPVINLIGNKNSKVFHYSWCTSVTNMKEKNKVNFENRDACVDAGYVPCNNCKP